MSIKIQLAKEIEALLASFFAEEKEADNDDSYSSYTFKKIAKYFSCELGDGSSLKVRVADHGANPARCRDTNMISFVSSLNRSSYSPFSNEYLMNDEMSYTVLELLEEYDIISFTNIFH